MKRKTKLIVSMLVITFLFVSIVSASMLIPANERAKEHAKAPLMIPAHAVEVAPGVFYLGKAIDKGKIVEGYAMFVKPGTVCGNGICDPGENVRKCPEDCTADYSDTSSCYVFLAKGAKWRTVEPYIVDPTNTKGLTPTFITENLAMDIGKWEDAANFNILGDEIAGVVDGADLESPDNKNEVYFADIDSPGAIAVAIVWGIFSGPPQSRKLVEWDIVFDDVDFDWGIGEAGKMDFESIATHELGHAVGLGDLYDSKCSEQTMYGYADFGETKKRTLESGDVAGIQKLYK